MTGGLDISKFIFIDEMGSNLAMTRLYGRAEPGERVFDKVPGDPGRNVSTIGAMGLDGIRTGLSVPGAIDGETMVFFVEKLLVESEGDSAFDQAAGARRITGRVGRSIFIGDRARHSRLV